MSNAMRGPVGTTGGGLLGVVPVGVRGCKGRPAGAPVGVLGNGCVGRGVGARIGAGGGGGAAAAPAAGANQ